MEQSIKDDSTPNQKIYDILIATKSELEELLREKIKGVMFSQQKPILRTGRTKY